MDSIPGVVVRWLHIASVTILIGGTFYARFVAGSLSARFRPWIWGAMATILGSGGYNLFTKEALPAGYHMVFGIKMLLVLHVFAVSLMITTPAFEDAKRLRMMTGVALSGLAVVLVSAYLRGMS